MPNKLLGTKIALLLDVARPGDFRHSLAAIGEARCLLAYRAAVLIQGACPYDRVAGLERQRLYFVLFSVPPWKEAEMTADEHTDPAWSASRVRHLRSRRRSGEITPELGESAVAHQFQRLEVRIKELEATLNEAGQTTDVSADAPPTTRDDPYMGVSGHVAEVLRNFDRDSERLRHEAQGEADRIVAEAKAEAEHLRSEALATRDEARAAAHQLLIDAKAQAEREISSISGRRDQIVEELLTLRVQVSTALDAVNDALDEADQRVVIPDQEEESIDASEQFGDSGAQGDDRWQVREGQSP